MSRNKKLYVNHVKQLKGEMRLLTSTKLARAEMTKLTLLSILREGTFIMTGKNFPFSRPPIKSITFDFSYSDSTAVAGNKNVGVHVVFPVVYANENTDCNIA